MLMRVTPSFWWGYSPVKPRSSAATEYMYIFLVKSEFINWNTEFELIYGKDLNLLKISSPKNENLLSKV